jgi:hypothetical protein
MTDKCNSRAVSEKELVPRPGAVWLSGHSSVLPW